MQARALCSSAKGMIPADPGAERRHLRARGRAALGTAWSGVWSVVGDLYSPIGRTLSTNWNLKFQRGKKKKRAEGTFACVETTLPCDSWTHGLCLVTGLRASPTARLAKWWWDEWGPWPCSGLSCSGEVSDPSPSLLRLHAKEKPLQSHSGLGAVSDMGATWSQGCKRQWWHHLCKERLVLLAFLPGIS